MMRYKELDLMRFFAALCVLLYHYTAGFTAEYFQVLSNFTQFGYLGVPFFFMISGFVIFASAHNRSALEFAISRFIRVYPTLFVCATFTVCILYFFNGGDTGVSVIQYLANLTLLNTYADIAYIDGVYWTLLAELKFYFCVFILLMLGWFNRYKVWLSVWLVMTVTFLVFKQPFFMGLFISPEYSAFFIAGIVFYLVRREGISGFYTFLLSVSLIMASIKAYAHVEQFIAEPGELIRWIAVSLICLFYALFFFFSLGKITLRSSAFLLTLGGMTYPLYLVHSRAGRSIFDYFIGLVNPYLLITLIIFFMLSVAYLVHIYVEKRLVSSLKNFLMGQCWKSSVSHKQAENLLRPNRKPG